MRQYSLNPAKALLLGFPVSLFLGALISDIAYYRSFQVQWANFAAWLNAGALLFGAIVLVFGVIDFLRHRESRGRAGNPVEFVSGFLKDGKARGRPVGVTVDPRGALIVADDLSNTIWRITPNRPIAAPTPALPAA